MKEELSWQDVVPAPLPAAPPELEHDTAVEARRAQLEELVRGGPGQEPGLTEAVAMVAEAPHRFSISLPRALPSFS